MFYTPVSPYRENAPPIEPPDPQSWFSRLLSDALQKLCAHGFHIGHHETVLKGGAGPDDATHALSCNRCGAYGWRYGDGDVSWRWNNPPRG